MNEDFDPSPSGESIIEIFKQEREETGESRMTPGLIRERSDEEISKQLINHNLRELVAAGWVKKIKQGLYEFVEDPR